MCGKSGPLCYFSGWAGLICCIICSAACPAIKQVDAVHASQAVFVPSMDSQVKRCRLKAHEVKYRPGRQDSSWLGFCCQPMCKVSIVLMEPLVCQFRL